MANLLLKTIDTTLELSQLLNDSYHIYFFITIFETHTTKQNSTFHSHEHIHKMP